MLLCCKWEHHGFLWEYWDIPWLLPGVVWLVEVLLPQHWPLAPCFVHCLSWCPAHYLSYLLLCLQYFCSCFQHPTHKSDFSPSLWLRVRAKQLWLWENIFKLCHLLLGTSGTSMWAGSSKKLLFLTPTWSAMAFSSKSPVTCNTGASSLGTTGRCSASRETKLWVCP